SCASAAEIVAALFFAEMRYDPRNPQNPDNDRFVLSKGHAAPVLYAAWAEVGFLKRDDLLTLRRLDSDLEGHPTPRLPFVDVATGSLGQGICAAGGIDPHGRAARRRRMRRGLGLRRGGSRRARSFGFPVRHHRLQRPGPERSVDLE